MRSFILNLPGFRERIGPIWAPALRVASRISNTLRRGTPVVEFSAFDPCRAIFVCLPDEALEESVRAMSSADLDWSGRTVVLSDTALTSRALTPLAKRGARIASLLQLPGPARMLLIEGDREALPDIKPLAGRAARVVRIPTDRKETYRRGLAIAELCAPVAALAGDHLREAGLTPAQTKPVIESVLLDAVRSYLKSGRKVLQAAERCDVDVLGTLLQAADCYARGAANGDEN